jgi:2-C-methyl-D-erythritol 2,4-cyclodiphosphate synthase
VSTRSGIGYDTHRLVAGRRLVLGGIELPSSVGLDGHSDADALTHAIIDALLGAAGLGDIGMHFPDSDERYRDADSIVLLAAALELVRTAGYEPVNVDATVALAAPKLGAAREQMRERLAATLGLRLADVNIKATTGEGLGFVGRGEGVAVFAIATLRAAGEVGID